MTGDSARRSQRETWLTAHAMENYVYRRAEAHERMYTPRRPAHEVPSGAIEELYDYVRHTIGDVPLVYLEFGVASGASIARMARRFGHPDARFFGFDSFQGLPEDWVVPQKTWDRGTFSTGGRPPVTSDHRMSFIKGWFQNTLPDFLDQGRGQFSNPVLVHYDADLYSSTLFILSTIWHHIPEYYFVFDEIIEQEMIALYDFSQAFPIEIEFLCAMPTKPGSQTPFKAFGRMRRVPLVVAGS